MKRRPLVVAIAACAPLLGGCPSFARGPLPGEPRDATFAVVDGVRLRYVDLPSAAAGPAAPDAAAGAEDAETEPVVLVHGHGVTLDEWRPVVPALAKAGHRVLAMDLKGFGYSDRPPGDYSPQAEAELVLHLMDQRGIRRAIVVGHSWGSSVVLAAVLASPARFSRIALYDGFVFTDQIPTASYWARAPGLGEAIFALYYPERVDEKLPLAFYDPNLVTQDLVDGSERLMAFPGTVAAALAAVRGHRRIGELEGRYATIRQPTLVLWGREDAVTPLAYGERLAASLPHAKLVVYPRCGHIPMYEASARSTADLLAFLAADEAP